MKEKQLIEKLIEHVKRDFYMPDELYQAELDDLIAELESSLEQKPTQMPADEFRQFIKDSIKNKTYQTRFNIACDFPQDKIEIMIDEIFNEWFKSRLSVPEVKRVYAFCYNPMIHESCAGVISLHTTQKDAEIAMMFHKEQERKEWEQSCKKRKESGDDFDYGEFGNMESWFIREFDILSVPEVRETTTDEALQTYFANHTHRHVMDSPYRLSVMTRSEAIAMVKHFLKLK